MLIAIILNNLEEAQTQYNELVKDKFKRKKQLVRYHKPLLPFLFPLFSLVSFFYGMLRFTLEP